MTVSDHSPLLPAQRTAIMLRVVAINTSALLRIIEKFWRCLAQFGLTDSRYELAIVVGAPKAIGAEDEKVI